MNESTDFLEMISFPYYAHLQAQLVNPIQSISWNKVSLLGYIDILLIVKDQIPPAGIQRKIRSLYESYENLGKNYPALGDLDGLFRVLTRLDKDQTEQVKPIALQWHTTVQVIEKMCLAMATRRHGFKDPSQLSEALQQLLFQMQESSVLPKLNDYLAEEQEEIRRIAQMRKYPVAIFDKLKLGHLFFGTYHTDKDQIQFLIEKDPELQDTISNINKTFFRLINQINQKLPETVRSLKTKPASQNLSAPSDYRFIVKLAYDGNDEKNEYETDFFDKLRNILRFT